MAYRPNHPVIIVVNSDGGGYVKQFNTMSEAKDFYKTITTDGVAYLYAAPKASLDFGNLSDSIPEYDNGMTYGTGALVKLNGTVYKLINFIGAGGYGPVTHPSAWTTNVTLPPPAPPISSTGLNDGASKGMAFNVNQLANGSSPFADVNDTLLSTTAECGFVLGYDRDGTVFNGSYINQTVRRYSSGRIERQTTGEGGSPCFYPNGYRIDFQDIISEFKLETKTIYSLDFGGTLYGPYYNPRYITKSPRTYVVADGNGGTTEVQETGVKRREDKNGRYQTTWFNYAVGDAPYKFDDDLSITDQIGQPIPNGRYLVTYKVDGDERIHSGAWVGRIDNVQEGTVVWKFEAETPDQPPPPPCSVRRPLVNPVNGGATDECDPTIVYPFSVYENCAEPIVVLIEGVEVTLGTNTKRGMDDGYGYVIWGECTGMVYVPNGQQVHDGFEYYYYSDGAGSYYAEPKTNNCPAAGTSISRSTTDITININDSVYTVGYQHEDTIADGNCGSSGVEISSEYIPSGILLTQDSTYYYYSNGAGSYYTESIIPPYGTELSSDSGDYTVDVGCGNFVTGNYSSTTYADGMGGTYSSGGDNYYSSGTLVGNCNDYNYYADGMGGAYQGEYTGGGGGEEHPPYGTYIDGNSSPIYANAGCSDWQVGNSNYSVYADGSGGTYSESGDSYYEYGQYLGNCNDYNYYSNGEGSYYEGEYTGGGGEGYPSYGTETGNGDSYPNYIDINGTQYENGTYSYTEYHDGNGGYYSESSTSYAPYGHYFGSQSYYDTETLTDIYTYYYSDGTGGYYNSY